MKNYSHKMLFFNIKALKSKTNVSLSFKKRTSYAILGIVGFLFFLLSSCQPTLESLQKSTWHLPTEWQFSQEGKDEWHPAKVPGVVHLDLWENGLIEDPYWEDNELKQRWIEDENWVYKIQFDIDANTLANEHIELRFEGLDTYAKVYLNGKEILEANNMFRTWAKEVKPLLKQGENELKVVFESPITHNKEWVQNYPHSLPSGNETEDIPVKVCAFTRKAAYQFGWDWGPRFVTSGIYKPVGLITWNKARILNASTTTVHLDSAKAEMKTLVEIEASQAGTYEITIGTQRIQQELKEGLNTLTRDFEVQNPQLWWANGLGEPHLYKQKIELFHKEKIVDEILDTYGIRTIELVNEPDSIGTAFYFKLNGKPTFMKGANYIPQDVFLPRVTPERYEQLIADVKAANMNMIRVWGGGVYEQDLFYELCDKNGILVWQDFMFAGSLYPDDQAFKDNIKAEATEQIKRLRRHPSLAVWCGNNEIEVAWFNWGWQKQHGYSPQDSVDIWKNYQSIFQELLPDLVKEHQPQIAYTSTSPLSNWGAAENFNHSSMHYWGVWHGREPFEAFEDNVGRFMVEYGFQSFPSLKTLRKTMMDSSLYWNSPTLAHRQKSYVGNGLILKHIKQYQDEPKSFEDFVRLSQDIQAKGMGMAIQAHLDGRPHCMGSLFWQLNDCWPGPSWSILDYYGEKKVAYEVVRRKFGEGSE